MILDFSIGNYRSFNNIQTLDFRATPLVSESSETDINNIVKIGGQGVLKTIGLYGPNGSGKSNLIEAFRLFATLIRTSLESEGAMDFAAEPFLLSKAISDNAGFFQVQLLFDEKKYRYGFTLNPNTGVLQEWLFGPAEKNETWYFKRTHDKVETNKEWFPEAQRLPLENLRSNALFLSFVSSYNGELCQKIKDYFSTSVFIEDQLLLRNRNRRSFLSNSRRNFAGRPNYLTNDLLATGQNNLVLNWLKGAGLNYAGITLELFHNDLERVWLNKNVYDQDGIKTGELQMDLDESESAGTKKFYAYIGILNLLFNKGGFLISDEIDNNFHPSLLKHFIKSFNDPLFNKAGAQLLFTSHDTNLLNPNILRRDQIYFTEKTTKDETMLYSLADLKGIRNNADFARQYLAGFYGALPILEQFKQ
ncbi:hypothetical protein SAMN04488505_103494 [Chitinophaga rupis]|uniref:ATPase AAA-type core domain-containing protein n=1 Tax=Chitinophaga rupis TaxID=573321 RepID=A0A1H7VY42_9BACT|nr:ATP-binding protein [Chitinophaga rupis]SEM14262.1 hypothetical protein SAMN04488505_103494 [Chitinophaga rupis]